MSILITEGGSESETLITSPSVSSSSAMSITSYQSGSISLGSGATSASVTLGTTVAQSNSILIVSASGGSNTAAQGAIRVALNSAGTEVTATRISSGSAAEVEYQLIESTAFNVQHFEQSLGNGTNSITITSVDTNYAFPICTGLTSNTTGTRNRRFTDSIEITSSTNVDVFAFTTSDVICFQIVEMSSAEIASVQLVKPVMTTTLVDTTITSVDETKSLIFATGEYNTTGNLSGNIFPTYELTSSTNLRSENRSASPDYTGFVYIVEFVNLPVTSNRVAGISGDTTTEVLGSAPTYGGAVINGFYGRNSTSADTDDDSQEDMWRSYLTGSTWTFERDNSTTVGDLSYSVFDWDDLFAGLTPILVLPDLSTSKSRPLNPSVLIFSSIDVSAEIARSSSNALAPSVVLGSPINVLPGVSRSVSNGLDPSVLIASQVDVNAISASSDSRVLTPDISIASAVEVSPSAARSLSTGLDPSVVLASSVSVNAAISRSSSNALDPSILLASDVTVLPGTASSKSNVLNPNISIGAGVFVFGDTGISTSSSLDPNILIAGQVDVQSETGSSSSSSLDPIISIASQIEVVADLARSVSVSNDPIIDIDETVVVLPLAPRSGSSTLRPSISVGQVVRIDQFTINYRQDDIVCAYADSIAIAKYEE